MADRIATALAILVFLLIVIVVNQLFTIVPGGVSGTAKLVLLIGAAIVSLVAYASMESGRY